MNEQVKSFIERAKAELEASKLKERNQHLISLGLKRSERKYQDSFSGTDKFDDNKKMYYKVVDVAIEVTDEEYNEICKYNPPGEKIKVVYQGSGVKTLNGFGTFFFVIASIAILAAAFGFFAYLGNENIESTMEGLSVASSLFPIAIYSFAGGAICKGLSTIAKTALYKRILLEKQYPFEELTNQ